MRISVPDPALVLLVGPSGSGKSTFARDNFTPTEVISSDSLRAMLADDPADQDASAEAFQLVALLASGRLKRRLTTVIDATNLRAVDRRRFRQQATRHEIPTIVVAFDLPVELYNENNRRRPDRVVNSDVVADQVERMREAMTDLEDEAYAALYVIRDADELAAASVERVSSVDR